MEKMLSDMPMPTEASPSGKKNEAMEMTSLTIEPADNGYIVRCSYKGKKDGYSTYEDTRKVFESGKAAAKFVTDLLE